ncbi:MAG: acylphosphatase [Oscillospiraceae bacterium]|nr:acylphosphatase [Oscillospiraceae bacterium]
MGRIRYELIFRGYVQGVGFRWRAYHAANALGITGFVENRSDGSVYMQAQGSEDEISELIDTLGRGSFIDIDDIEKKRLPPEEYENGFEIRI